LHNCAVEFKYSTCLQSFRHLRCFVTFQLHYSLQLAKSRENTLICLLLDVKEVFDHVALKQLIKILIRLKISVNLINWVKCFLQNRIIDLAFDDECQKSKKISTEISQDSSISLILFLIYIRYLFSKIRAKFKNL